MGNLPRRKFVGPARVRGGGKPGKCRSGNARGLPPTLPQPTPDKEGVEVGIPAHEAPEELVGIPGISAGEDRILELATGVGVEDALALEAGEAVRVEDLRPFVGVVSGGVAGGAGKEVGEAPRHGNRPGFQRGLVAFEDLVGEGVKVRVSVAFPGSLAVVDVQLEVQLSERQLPHHRRGTQIIPGRRHALEEFGGNRLAGLEVLGKKVQALALPTVVFHELRGQFHKVPSHLHAVERFHFHLAEEVVEEVAELVENRDHLVVLEEGGLVSDRGRHVAANQSQMRIAVPVSGRRATGAKMVHPSPAALGLARVPVSVERSQMDAVRAVDLVELNLGMPDLDRTVVPGIGRRRTGLAGLVEDGLALPDPDVEDLLCDLEHAREDTVDGKIGAKFLVIEIEEFLAPFFRPVCGLPGLERLGMRARFLGTVFLKLRRFPAEGGGDPAVEILDELQGSSAGPRHATLEDKVREIPVAQQLRLLLPEPENFPDEVGIVELSAPSHCARSLVGHLAQHIAVEVLHQREIGGRVQGEAPHRHLLGAQILFPGGLKRGIDGGLREPGQFRLVLDHHLPGIGGIENVLAELLRGLRQGPGNFLQPRLFLRSKPGPALPEIGHRLVHEAPLDPVHDRRAFGLREGGHQIPERLVEIEPGPEFSDLREHGVLGLPQGVGIANRVQMGDLPPGIGEDFGRLLESQKHVRKSHPPPIRPRQLIEIGLGTAQGLLNVGNNRVRSQPGPGDVKGFVEMRMTHKDWQQGTARRLRPPSPRRNRDRREIPTPITTPAPKNHRNPTNMRPPDIWSVPIVDISMSSPLSMSRRRGLPGFLRMGIALTLVPRGANLLVKSFTKFSLSLDHAQGAEIQTLVSFSL